MRFLKKHFINLQHNSKFNNKRYDNETDNEQRERDADRWRQGHQSMERGGHNHLFHGGHPRVRIFYNLYIWIKGALYGSYNDNGAFLFPKSENGHENR